LKQTVSAVSPDNGCKESTYLRNIFYETLFLYLAAGTCQLVFVFLLLRNGLGLAGFNILPSRILFSCNRLSRSDYNRIAHCIRVSFFDDCSDPTIFLLKIKPAQNGGGISGSKSSRIFQFGVSVFFDYRYYLHFSGRFILCNSRSLAFKMDQVMVSYSPD
jgi:hypothetical protein